MRFFLYKRRAIIIEFKVAEYYIQMNDEEKAILALEAFVLRSREFGRKADSQHQTLVGTSIYTR